MKNKLICWITLFFAFFLLSLSIEKLSLPLAIDIFETLEKSILTTNNGLLVIAAVKSVIYEGFIDLPVFLLGYSFTFFYFKNMRISKKVIYLIILTIFLYFLNRLIFESKWEVIILILILISETALMAIFGKNRENFTASSIVLIQLNFALYGLLLTTVLDNFGVGNRDLITSIKLGAGFLRGSAILNFVSFSVFIPLMIGAFLLTLLSILSSRRLESEKREKQKERELRLVKSVAEEAHVWQELHYLVHDLKSPLMTMAGLNSLIEMQVENPRLKEYCRRIDKSVETINQMISEFLDNEKRKITTVEQLTNFVRAHVVEKNVKAKVLFKIEENIPSLNINTIRMSRALINVIENSLRAVSLKNDPVVIIKIFSNKKGEVVLVIKDNGVGIVKEDLEKIWNIGFTTKDKSGGLGMSFIKKVIEDHQGQIIVNSKEGQGTEVVITLPGVKE